MIYEALADGVMPSGHKSDFELGADSIRARDENRGFEIMFIKFEKTAEQADIRQDIFIESPADKPLDLGLCPVRCINIHPGIFICSHWTLFFFFHFLS
jgi:hypothetical protein